MPNANATTGDKGHLPSRREFSRDSVQFQPHDTPYMQAVERQLTQRGDPAETSKSCW
jgi:hypothetical protein